MDGESFSAEIRSKLLRAGFPWRRCWPVLLAWVVAGACACGPAYVCPQRLARHSAATGNPMIHQQGQRLLSPDGRPVRLIGANAGGWFHFESWLWGSRLAIFDMERHSESSIEGRLVELYGRRAADDIVEAIRAGYITGEDFRAMAEMGFNSLRLPIHHRLLSKPSGWAHLDRAVQFAEQYGVLLIIDLHAAPGGQSRIFPADPTPTLLWDDAAAQQRTVALWRQIAARYANRGGVAAYDLLNEPDAPRDEQLVALYRKIIAAIRSVDPHHLIMLEGNALARDFELFDKRLDHNLVYQPHQYIWFSLDPQRIVDGYGELGRCHDVPIFIGEFGENTPAKHRSLREAYERAGFAGWSFWPWKKAPNGQYPGLVEIDAPPSFRTLVEDLEADRGAPASLDAAQARAAVDDFLAASRIDRARVNPALATALGVRLPSGS